MTWRQAKSRASARTIRSSARYPDFVSSRGAQCIAPLRNTWCPLIDTTIANGRFVSPDGPIDHAISIHEGVVLDGPEFDQVWRTIEASGHLVFPGLIQPGTLDGDTPLNLARNGTTTVILTEQPEGTSTIDHLVAGGQAIVVKAGEPGAVNAARLGTCMIEIPAMLLDESNWLALANDETVPVHVTHGGDPAFPLLQYLYHQAGMAPARIAAVTSRIPARWYGVHPEKGSYKPGSHGDVVVFDPETSDPYRESTLPGRVILSMQRGEMLLYNGELHPPVGAGKTLST